MSILVISRVGGGPALLPPPTTSSFYLDTLAAMTEPPSPSTPKRKDAYDYSNTTWEQDRDAALEVERRLLKRLDELKKDKVADEESKESKGDTKEDEAARVLQRRYSSVFSPLLPRHSGASSHVPCASAARCTLDRSLTRHIPVWRL